MSLHPPETKVTVDISFNPAEHGTRQFLQREQAVHQLYQNRREPAKDFDFATAKKNGSVTNPGMVLSFDLGIGDKQYRFSLDNTSSAVILNVQENEIPSSAQKVKGDVLDLAKGALSVSKYTDTAHLYGLSLPNFPFHVPSKQEGLEVKRLSNTDGVIGNFPNPNHEGPISGFGEYMLMSTISLTYERANAAESAKAKFSKGVLSLGELPPSVGSTVMFTASSVKRDRKQYCDDVPFRLDLSYGNDESDSEVLDQGGVAIWDHVRTFIMFPSDLFEKYKAAVGAELDEKTGLLTVTDEQYRKMKSLFFRIGEAKHELVPNAQIWPRDLNSVLGGEQGKIYLSIADSGIRSGKAFDICLGYVFLQRLHLVVDAPNDRLGFGPTHFTEEIIN